MVAPPAHPPGTLKNVSLWDEDYAAQGSDSYATYPGPGTTTKNNSMNDVLGYIKGFGDTAAGVIGAIKQPKGTAKTTVEAGNQNKLLIPIAIGAGVIVLLIVAVLAFRRP